MLRRGFSPAAEEAASPAAEGRNVSACRAARETYLTNAPLPWLTERTRVFRAPNATVNAKRGNIVAVVLSYRWQRNPERLLRSWGMGPRVRSSHEEKRFLDRLDDAPDNELGNFCLVMGGFTDAFFGRAYAILGDLPALLGKDFDIYYREYDEIAAARRLLRRYGELPRRLVLIGHSWGASSLARDVVPACRSVRVDALVTLDPVGVRGPLFLPQVRRWLNVYVPYDKAPWSRENNIARLGRPWEFVRQAGVNRIFSPFRHADARGMFRAFGEGFIRLVLLER